MCSLRDGDSSRVRYRKRGGLGVPESPVQSHLSPAGGPGACFPTSGRGCELSTAGVRHPSRLLCIIFIHSLIHSSLIPSFLTHSFNPHAWCPCGEPGSRPQSVSPKLQVTGCKGSCSTPAGSSAAQSHERPRRGEGVCGGAARAMQTLERTCSLPRLEGAQVTSRNPAERCGRP